MEATEAGFAPLRVRITVDSEDEDFDGSLAASKSSDSTVEHMATFSNADSLSPLVSFKDHLTLSEVSRLTFNGALRQLNELNSGIASLDTSLLENTSESSFRFRVMEIALSNHLSLGDEVVHDILNALSPVVREKFKQNTSGKEAEYSCVGDMPLAKLTSDDDDDISDKLDDACLGSFQEASGLENSEDRGILRHSARGLPVRIALDDESEEHEEYTSPPSVKLSISTQMANAQGGFQHISVPSDDIEIESAAGNERVKGELSMCYEEPGIIKHCGKHAENQNKPLGESDQVKNTDDALSCALIEASANEYTTPHVLQTSVSKAESMHKCEQEGLNNDDLVTRSADGSTRRPSAAHRQQLEETSEEARQSLDVASLLQMIKSISNFEHAFESTALSTQLKEIKETLWNRQARFEEKGNECLEVKDLLTTDNHMCGNEGHTVAGHLEDMLGNEKKALEMGLEELVLDRKSKEQKDNRAAKFDDEVATEPTEERFLSLNSSTAPATGMPLIGNARSCMCVQGAGLGYLFPSFIHDSQAVSWINEASAPSLLIASKNDHAKGIVYTRKKLRLLGVKFLRLVHRLEQSVHNAVVAQVLYRLELIEQLRSERNSVDYLWKNLIALAEKQEATAQGDLDFECTILAIGKSGVGKSATLNSLFDETKSRTDAYKPATKKVSAIYGTVKGIKLRMIDTPGLLTSFAEQKYNYKVMSSVKHYIKKLPPDIVLYFDRLDMLCRDHGDSLILQTITDTLGRAIWYNAIVVLTHGSSPPPDGANGLPISHNLFVAQRSHVVQQTIRQAGRDMQLMNPVCLVENHIAHSFTSNGQAWKPQLLLLCCASKILAEANILMKLHESSPKRSFWVRPQIPPLPFLLSSMLQSRTELKLRNEEVYDLDEEADIGDDEEYDSLPSFRTLSRDELRLLDMEHRRLHNEELQYREKLFMKKQFKDDRARQKDLKRRLIAPPKKASDLIDEHVKEASSFVVPVSVPDIALPHSFDSGNTHRYHFPDTPSQWLVCPVPDAHGWDCDGGYDGLNLEKITVLSREVPVSVSGQIVKDKNSVCEVSDGKVTQAGLGIQTLGKDVLYTVCSETKFSNLKKNKTTCGISITMLADTVATGMKIENHIQVGKRFELVLNGGVFTGAKDAAFGESLEASLRDKDYPIRSWLSTIGISIINWHGGFAIGGKLQWQVLSGKTMVVARASLNNQKSGQISIRASSSEQMQMVLIGMMPLLSTFINKKILG